MQSKPSQTKANLQGCRSLFLFALLSATFVPSVTQASCQELLKQTIDEMHQAVAHSREQQKSPRSPSENPFQALMASLEPLKEVTRRLEEAEAILKQDGYLREDEELTPETLHLAFELFPGLQRYLVGLENESQTPHYVFTRALRRGRLLDGESGKPFSEADVRTFLDRSIGFQADTESLRRVQANVLHLLRRQDSHELLVFQMNPIEAIYFYTELRRHANDKQSSFHQRAIDVLAEIQFQSPQIQNSDARLGQLAAVKKRVDELYTEMVMRPLAQASKAQEKAIHDQLRAKASDPEFRAKLMQLQHYPIEKLVRDAVGTIRGSQLGGKVAKVLTGDTRHKVGSFLSRNVITKKMMEEFVRIIQASNVELDSSETAMMYQFERFKTDDEGKPQQRPTETSVRVLSTKLQEVADRDPHGYFQILLLLTERVRFNEGQWNWEEATVDARGDQLFEFTEEFVLSMTDFSQRENRRRYKEFIHDKIGRLALKDQSGADGAEGFHSLSKLAELFDMPLADLTPPSRRISENTPAWLLLLHERFHGTIDRRDPKGPMSGDNLIRNAGEYQQVSADRAFGEDPLQSTYFALQYWAIMTEALTDINLDLPSVLGGSTAPPLEASASSRILVLIDIERFGQFDLAHALPTAETLKANRIQKVTTAISVDVPGVASSEASLRPSDLQEAANLRNQDPEFYGALLDSEDPLLSQFANSNASIFNPTLFGVGQRLQAYQENGMTVDAITIADRDLDPSSASKPSGIGGWIRNLFGGR